MKVTVLILLLFASNVNIAFSQIKEMSDSAKALAEKVREGDNQSVLNAGKSEDKTLIPYLKTLASKGSPWAQMALAKLGENEYLNQILAEVDAEDPNIQDRAMEKLSYVGGKVAFKRFYELLDDTAPRLTESRCVIFFTRSTMAMFFLRKMVDNPPTQNTNPSDRNISLWKEWFLINKYLIEDY